VKAGELRDLSIDELETKRNELRDELFNARVKHSTGQLESTARLATLRRDIARVATVLREKSEVPNG
jgi:large subunit ribosomal protein L29